MLASWSPACPPYASSNAPSVTDSSQSPQFLAATTATTAETAERNPAPRYLQLACGRPRLLDLSRTQWDEVRLTRRNSYNWIIMERGALQARRTLQTTRKLRPGALQGRPSLHLSGPTMMMRRWLVASWCGGNIVLADYIMILSSRTGGIDIHDSN